MEKWPKVSIIILNWNSWRDTIECLESLQRLTYSNYQVIVVDNGSIDGSQKKIKNWILHNYQKNNIKIIEINNNLGFSGGNNVGIRYVLRKKDLKFIWLLNNDTVVEKNALKEMVITMNDNLKVAFCGSVILDYYNHDIIQTVGGGKINKFLGLPRPIMRNEIYNLERIQQNQIKPEYITGCSFLINVKHLRKIGFMDNTFFLYWEDTEWSERCKRKGFSLLYAPGSKIWHKKGNSSAILKKGAYYDSLNCLIFFKRYYPGNLPLVLVTRVLVGIIIFFKHTNFMFLKEFIKGYLCFIKKIFI